MKWFVIGFASFILFFFSSFLPSKYAFAQSYCDQGDVCMDVYDELACQNTFSGRWMVDGCFRPEPLEDGDCCVSNGCSDTQYCTFYSYPAYINCPVDGGTYVGEDGCRIADGASGNCCLGCIGEGDGRCSSSIACCGYPEYTCQFISETERICLPSSLDCGNQGDPCCPTGDECYGEDVECTDNPIDGERVCLASYAKECSDAHCDGDWGYCGVGDFDADYIEWGCENSTFDCNSDSRESCADCWCCPDFNFPYSAGEGPEDDYCSIPTIPPAATIVPRAGLPVQGDCPVGSIDTAVGCLPVSDKNAFLSFILRWAIGIAGGVSFILIASSGFMIITAAGDKRKLQGGKELLTAAVSGLFLIIFSVFILDLIGIRILRIPGL